MAEPFLPLNPNAVEREPRNWVPMIVGLALVVLVVAGIAILGRNRPKPPAPPDPYAQFLQVSNARLSQADNFVGSTVTYLDFTVTNTGTKTLVGGQAVATFKNTLGEVVQTEQFPMRALVKNSLGGYSDQVDLSLAPIAPGKSQDVRLTLEHVSDDWNQAAPDMKFVNLKLQ